MGDSLRTDGALEKIFHENELDVKLQNETTNQIGNIQCSKIDADEAPVIVFSSTSSNFLVSHQRALSDGACINDTAKTHCTRSWGPDNNSFIVHDRPWLSEAISARLSGSISFLSSLRPLPLASQYLKVVRLFIYPISTTSYLCLQSLISSQSYWWPMRS